jgi:glucosylceramidase
MITNREISIILAFIAFNTQFLLIEAQHVEKFTTTEKIVWQRSETKLTSNAQGKTLVSVTGNDKGTAFQAWGTTFNELDWEAFNMLTSKQQNELMSNLYSPSGDLHFTHGRVSMNANDYARSWYSCDEVAGDFNLKYFNIDRDKEAIIPLARAAQKYYPQLQLFMSPWSPPEWMKINQDYAVSPSRYNKMDERKSYLLFMDDGKNNNPDEMQLLGDRKETFPRRLASQDYFIQDSRYLQCYADMFCKFIDLYAQQGLHITKVMYQNEAYSYTPYPGCAWTAEGTLHFNNDYLIPTLAKLHPEVELWMGTINTNRLDYVERILDDSILRLHIKGVGTQWECRNNLPQIRQRYPNLRMMVSESECGNGSMDWKAGEHTFFLISDNLGNGCDEYYNWNFILTDNGISPWGWKQNALVQVDSQTHEMRYTAEYYAYKHFSHFVTSGAMMIGYSGRNFSTTPVVVFKIREKNRKSKYVITAGNLTDNVAMVNVRFGAKYLNIQTQPHSFNTYVLIK